MSDQQEQGENDLRELRAAAERGTAAQKEAEALRRELAFTKAGIDVATPLGAMFAKSYDGALDSTDVTAAWSEIAPPATTPPPSTEHVADSTESEETAQRRLLTSGGSGDTPRETPPADPVQRGFDSFQERIKGGERRETAAGAVFGSLIQGAMEGDERALWNGWTKEQMG